MSSQSLSGVEHFERVLVLPGTHMKSYRCAILSSIMRYIRFVRRRFKYRFIGGATRYGEKEC